MDISDAIRLIREEKRLRQVDVASALGTDQSNYAYLEKRGDKLTIEQLRKIADALGVTIKDILFYGQNIIDETVVGMQAKLRECAQQKEELRIEKEKLNRMVHKVAYDQGLIVKEMLAIINDYDRVIKYILNHMKSENEQLSFAGLWSVFLALVNKESEFIKGYLNLKKIHFEIDYINISLVLFYECFDFSDHFLPLNRVEAHNMLFNNEDKESLNRLIERTQRKLDMKYWAQLSNKTS